MSPFQGSTMPRLARPMPIRIQLIYRWFFLRLVAPVRRQSQPAVTVSRGFRSKTQRDSRMEISALGQPLLWASRSCRYRCRKLSSECRRCEAPRAASGGRKSPFFTQSHNPDGRLQKKWQGLAAKICAISSRLSRRNIRFRSGRFGTYSHMASVSLLHLRDRIRKSPP